MSYRIGSFKAFEAEIFAELRIEAVLKADKLAKAHGIDKYVLQWIQDGELIECDYALPESMRATRPKDD